MSKRLALLSVFNKDGMVDFATALAELDFDLLASGGTAKCLLGAGLPVKDVAELVGGGPIFGHRVATLSREIHASILARDCDLAELAAMNIPKISLVCVDLYPTHIAANAPDATWGSIIEMVDIGGPAMLNAAAKACENVIVLGDKADWQSTLDWLKAGEPHAVEYRQLLAVHALQMTGAYYTNGARYLEHHRQT